MQGNFCEVGDLVKCDYSCAESGTVHKWVGLLVWTCGYKYTFLIDGVEDTWVLGDLEVIGAEVVSHAGR